MDRREGAKGEEDTEGTGKKRQLMDPGPGEGRRR